MVDVLMFLQFKLSLNLAKKSLLELMIIKFNEGNSLTKRYKRN